MKSREEFWDDWPIESKAIDMVYESDFSKALRLNDAELKTVNQLVFDIVYHSLDAKLQKQLGSSAEHQAIIDHLDLQQSFNIEFTGNADRFVGLETLMIDALANNGLLEHIKGIQFPIDVRVVQAKAPLGYLDRVDAIDYMHCDGWRGEPNDGVNCLLYCVVDDDSSRLNILDLPKNRMPDMANFTGDEKNTGNLLEGLNPIIFPHEPGVLVLFDSYAPHHAHRRGNKTRISLNFSLRRNDVYSVIDERWGRNRQSWDKYWYLPQSNIGTFKARCESEIKQLVDAGKDDIAILRLHYIDNKLLKNSNEAY